MSVNIVRGRVPKENSKKQFEFWEVISLYSSDGYAHFPLILQYVYVELRFRAPNTGVPLGCPKSLPPRLGDYWSRT